MRLRVLHDRVDLLGSAALSYDTLIGVFTGETSLAGGWFDSLMTL